MSARDLAFFMAADTLDTILESLAEATERGLSPPTVAEREARWRCAADLVIETGNAEWKQYALDCIRQKKDVKSGTSRAEASTFPGRTRSESSSGHPGASVARPGDGAGGPQERQGAVLDGPPVG